MTYEEAVSIASTSNSSDNQPFVIDKNLRTIAIPDNFLLGVKGDADVQIIPFVCPRYVNGIDLSEFSTSIIFRYNTGDQENYETYIPEDVVASEDTISFSWVVGQSAFNSEGTIEASVEFEYDSSVGSTHTARIISSNNDGSALTFVRYSGTGHYAVNDSFTFVAGEALECFVQGVPSGASVYVDGVVVSESVSTGQLWYTYTLPSHDINISIYSGNGSRIDLDTANADESTNMIHRFGTRIIQLTVADSLFLPIA